jgi:hypothetical protein
MEVGVGEEEDTAVEVKEEEEVSAQFDSKQGL